MQIHGLTRLDQGDRRWQSESDKIVNRFASFKLLDSSISSFDELNLSRGREIGEIDN